MKKSTPTRDDLAAQLAATLDDLRLTRGEKREFSSDLAKAAATDDDRAYLRHLAFKLARERIEGDSGAHDVLDWLEGVNKALLPERATNQVREVHFSPGIACRERIRRAFHESRRSADVCVFTITDNEVRDAILGAHHRGVLVRLITDNDKSEDLGSDIDHLHKAGIAVRVDQTEHHMHHKFAVFDDTLLLSGSYNWTRSAARHNEENILVTDEASLVRPFRDEFERLWQHFR